MVKMVFILRRGPWSYSMHVIHLFILFEVISTASKVTLTNIGKSNRAKTQQKIAKLEPIAYFTGCILQFTMFGIRRISVFFLHHMTTTSNRNISALLAICAGNSPVSGAFPAQRQVTRSFYVFFDLRPNKRLGKQLRSWWFETHSPPIMTSQ